MTEWIKCSERLPPKNKIVLIYSSGVLTKGVHSAKLIDLDHWVPPFQDHRFPEYINITHWAELPEAPHD